jgi:uncharacterized iron-regulated membrane protein
MKNKGLITVHSLTGLFAGIFIFSLSLSGTLLIFHDDIDVLQKPAIVSAGISKKIVSIDSCYTLIQQKYPSAIISSCNIAANEQEPFLFTIYDSCYQMGTKGLQLFLHPQTGAILKTRGGSEDIKNNLMGWLSKFHNSFHAGKTGEWLLGVFAIIFLLSIITGIIVYRKSILSVLLLNKTTWKRNNLHQLIGTWALLFNLMIGITGFWMQRYVFKKGFYSNSAWTNTFKPSPNLFFNFDSAYTNLQQQFPNFTGYVFYFAQNKKAKTAIYGSNKTNAFIHSKKFADVIFLDSSGAVAKTRFINEIDASDRYDIINAQLHMGKYGGMPVKIIYSLLGITSGLLSITGFLFWLKRKKRSKKELLR